MKKLFDLDGKDIMSLRDESIPTGKKRLVLQILVHGKPVRGAKQASCELCGAKLGSMIYGAHGFEWPQGATHYVSAHSIWTPQVEDLLVAWAKETGGNVSGL